MLADKWLLSSPNWTIMLTPYLLSLIQNESLLCPCHITAMVKGVLGLTKRDKVTYVHRHEQYMLFLYIHTSLILTWCSRWSEESLSCVPVFDHFGFTDHTASKRSVISKHKVFTSLSKMKRRQVLQEEKKLKLGTENYWFSLKSPHNNSNKTKHGKSPGVMIQLLRIAMCINLYLAA